MWTEEHDTIDLEHISSPTGRVMQNLELFGFRPNSDERDPRALPHKDDIAGAVTELFDTMTGTIDETGLAPELDDVLWSLVNLFHRSADRMQRQLDRNVDAQHHAQRAQDGSEVQSVLLEDLICEGQLISGKRDSFEEFRDRAADLFEMRTGSVWRPRTGTKIGHKTMTASVIDSRDFVAAKRTADIRPLSPVGTRIGFAGGLDCNDHETIWNVLDRVRAKHEDMVLIHGGSPRGAELIAAKWASNRKVVQIEFKPDWTRHAKAAPFKRNDALLDAMPVGIVIFPGSGITENLADKARRLGIPVWKFGAGRP
jgi:hypothetical protein